ncbi:MAG: ACP S-malonyltransferase, partial [Vicinamibacteria bacterium]
MRDVALLFPGQGSQAIGMGKELARSFPAAAAVFEEADEVLGFFLSRICFEGPERELQRTEITQPGVLAVSVAVARALESRLPLRPALSAGHSLGEYSALVAAGALPLADALRLVHLRGRLMQEAVAEGDGGMVAVLGAARETV